MCIWVLVFCDVRWQIVYYVHDIILHHRKCYTTRDSRVKVFYGIFLADFGKFLGKNARNNLDRQRSCKLPLNLYDGIFILFGSINSEMTKQNLTRPQSSSYSARGPARGEKRWEQGVGPPPRASSPACCMKTEDESETKRKERLKAAGKQRDSCQTITLCSLY